MDFGQEELSRSEFRNILFDLAKSDLSLSDASTRSKVYQRLESLYYSPEGTDNYRHFYSDIFMVLTSIQQGDAPGNIETLGQNLAAIRRGYQPKNKDKDGNTINIQNSLRKLYDHVSLDIARINYSDAADRKLEEKDTFVQIRGEINSLKESVSDANESINSSVDEAFNEIEKIQKEYVAILGIFASIVLTFTGGIAFSTSVFENMHLVSVYRMIVATLLIGIIFTNVIYGMFYYINKIVQKTQESKKRFFTPLWVSNVILILLLVVTVCAWKVGCVEERNIEITQKQQEIIAETYPH